MSRFWIGVAVVVGALAAAWWVRATGEVPAPRPAPQPAGGPDRPALRAPPAARPAAPPAAAAVTAASSSSPRPSSPSSPTSPPSPPSAWSPSPSPSPPPPPPPPPPPEVADWRTSLGSADPRERAAAVDRLSAEPGDESLRALEDILGGEPDPRVRERAVLALAIVLGEAAVARLRKVALEDPDENVGAAARASLHRLAREHPTPPRGRLEVVGPAEPPALGRPFDLAVRFASTIDVPVARLSIRLPPGLEPLDRDRAFFKGPLVAGEERVVRLSLTPVVDPLRGVVRVRLTIDPEEMLDVDVIDRRFRISIENGAGTFEPAPGAETEETGGD